MDILSKFYKKCNSKRQFKKNIFQYKENLDHEIEKTATRNAREWNLVRAENIRDYSKMPRPKSLSRYGGRTYTTVRQNCA
jgi:hypothetical protein